MIHPTPANKLKTQNQIPNGKLRIFIVLLLLLPGGAKAQEMWGISNSNFSGNMGIFLNPTTIVGAPYQYEINLIAFDVFAENANVYSLKNEKAVFHGLTGSIQRRIDYNETGLQNTFAHTLVIGPSYIRNKTRSAWGIHTAFRSEFSASGISPVFAATLYDDLRTPSLYGTYNALKPFSSAYATWLELGGTYGKILRENEKNVIKWAINVNLLGGLSAYSIDARSLDYTLVDTSQLIVHRTDATISHAVNAPGESMFGLRGLGLSTTLGLTYIKNINRGAFDCNMSNDKQRKYKYRLGVSILDLGLIHYFNDAQVINVVTQTDVVWNGIDTLKTGSLQSIDTSFVRNANATINNKSFNIWLPLAISVQFDYQLRPNVFANASVVNRYHFTSNQIVIANSFLGLGKVLNVEQAR